MLCPSLLCHAGCTYCDAASLELFHKLFNTLWHCDLYLMLSMLCDAVSGICCICSVLHWTVLGTHIGDAVSCTRSACWFYLLCCSVLASVSYIVPQAMVPCLADSVLDTVRCCVWRLFYMHVLHSAHAWLFRPEPNELNTTKHSAHLPQLEQPRCSAYAAGLGPPKG